MPEGGRTKSAYLDPAAVSRLGRLDLVARLVVEGFITGLHRSPYHGFSVEFSEHRPYMPGDPLRDLDWKVLAKNGRLYVKQYEEETNLKAYLLLDASGSMAFQSDERILSKFDYGSSLLASLAFLMLRQRDAVGLSLFRDKLVGHVPPRSVQSHLQVLLTEIGRATPGDDTQMAPAFHDLAERFSRRGLVVLVSDLLDDAAEVLRGLRHFRHRGHEVIVFHVLDPRERDLDFEKVQTRFYDLEDEDATITTQPWHMQEEYRRQMDELIQTYRKGCAEARIDYVLLDTTTPFDVALSRYLVRRKMLG
jgi:uncharacterized protein (DUF58 family)